MGEGGGGEEKERFLSFISLSLFHFHLSPFSPETPDTQARHVLAFLTNSKQRDVIPLN